MENKMKNNSIEYVLAGDYYIPDLKLTNEERPIGKYGRMHRDYLKEYNPMMFDHLVLEGRLWRGAWIHYRKQERALRYFFVKFLLIPFFMWHNAKGNFESS